MNILICGIKGKMGKAIYNELSSNSLYNITGFDLYTDEITSNDLSFSLNNIDIVIDFTKYDISKEIILESINRQINIISGTTGFSKEEILYYKDLANRKNVKFIWSPNYSKGYNFILNEAINISNNYDKCDIIEVHNNTKADKPSGSAIEIANALNFNIENINAVRLNNALAIHSLILDDDYERLIITHEITNRLAFVKGFMKVFLEICGG